jgi:hypothetical protein
VKKKVQEDKIIPKINREITRLENKKIDRMLELFFKEKGWGDGETKWHVALKVVEGKHTTSCEINNFVMTIGSNIPSESNWGWKIRTGDFLVKIGKLNIAALKDKLYFFIPTADYSECPHCRVLCEIQAWYYGHYCEGPGFVRWIEEPCLFRCPSCLEVIRTLPLEYAADWSLARWECIGNDIVAEDWGDFMAKKETVYEVKQRAIGSLQSLIDSTKADARKFRENGRFDIARALELQAKHLEDELQKW